MELEGSSSDSDDDSLEEVAFLSNPSTQRPQTSTVNVETINKEKTRASIGSRLDELLLNHKDERIRDEKHQKIKAQLLSSIERGSQDVGFESDGEKVLNKELDERLQRFDVKSHPLPSDHPTTTVFSHDKFCCLFRENILPDSCGFSGSGSHSSTIDNVLGTMTSENIIPLLQSYILPSCFQQISNPDSVMMWLFSLLSIHSSSLLVDLCSNSMEGIIVQNFSGCGRKPWYPRPIELVRIFVNMGASSTDLLSGQTLYTEENVEENLAAVKDKNKSVLEKSPGKLNIENLRHLLEILTKCLQKRPDISKAELDMMMTVITKISFDEMFQDLGFQRTFQALLSSILDAYSETDWPSVVPSLCHQLSPVARHHHHAVYLSELMPYSVRGNYLQIRLSFLLLCSMLEPERKEEHDSLQLDEVSPSAIAKVGHEGRDSPEWSQLYHCLHHLIKEDVYKLNSAVSLLDRTVGDEMNRNRQLKLQYLANQVKHIAKEIPDSFHTLDLSRIEMKDKIIIMTDKWIRVSVQNTKSVQRSMFSYLGSLTKETVVEEKLHDSINESEMDDINI